MSNSRSRTQQKRRKSKGVYSPMELVELGFGTRAHIYKLISDGVIPSSLLGKKRIIPGAWVHERTDLQEAV